MDRERLFRPTPDTTRIRFWAAIQKHKSPGLNYITGHIVASSVETMDPINSTNQSSAECVCASVCVHVLNSPLSVSAIKAYYLECELSLRFFILVKNLVNMLWCNINRGCGSEELSEFSMVTGPNTCSLCLISASQNSSFFPLLLNPETFVVCRICFS